MMGVAIHKMTALEYHKFFGAAGSCYFRDLLYVKRNPAGSLLKYARRGGV